MEKIGDYLTIEDFQYTTCNVPTETRQDRWAIRSVLHTETPVKVLYIASLELDGMEMIESFRLSVEPGKQVIPLPEIFVFNPIRSQDDHSGKYSLVLKIFLNGGKFREFPLTVRF